MKIHRLMVLFRMKRLRIGAFLRPVNNSYFLINNHHQGSVFGKRCFSKSTSVRTQITFDGSDSDNESDVLDYDLVEKYNIENEEGFARDLLTKPSKDLLFERIYNCSSIQELFNVFNTNKNEYNTKHLVETVLVLYDLKKVIDNFQKGTAVDSSSDFLQELNKNINYQNLNELIERKVNYFNLEELSYIFLYLIKLKIPLEEPLPQILSQKLHKDLLKSFSISAAARYLQAVFYKFSLKSYLMSQELIPLVLNELDLCTTTATFDDLTLCLNKLHNLITEETLNKYKLTVVDFIKSEKITSSDYKLIVKILMFLNHAPWREGNSVIMAQCMLLLKENLNLLNLDELTTIFEVFSQIQEPGDIINELQRCCSKYLQKMDDEISVYKVELFTSIVYFTSSSSRLQFQNILKKYVKKCNDVDSLIRLKAAISNIKVSDIPMYRTYWDKMLNFVKSGDIDNLKIFQICQIYMRFNTTLSNYKHHNIEKELLKLLEKLAMQPEYDVIPAKTAVILSFVLLYGSNVSFIEHLVKKIEGSWEQLKYLDCLRLATSLNSFDKLEDKFTKVPYANRINSAVIKAIEKEASRYDKPWKNTILIKSCQYAKSTNTKLIEQLLRNFETEEMSSKTIENVCHSFLSTNSFSPKVLDAITDYVYKHKNNVLAFNVEKILYLCYWMAHPPKNGPEFFDIAANIIIRDQERMSGLSLIHSALSLCYFNHLPTSIIKSIFNVEFLDKLDTELQNCYYKDKYPLRVRSNLMQLNRAVCLEYPEANVPWFHQKYVDELHRRFVTNSFKVFPRKIKDYLSKTLQTTDGIMENILTPYGYNINFVIYLGAQNEIVLDANKCTKKLAILLVPQYAYTQLNVKLGGKYQMKNRHLEMLGYTVLPIDFTEWIRLNQDEDRIEFLSRLLWPKNYNELKENYR